MEDIQREWSIRYVRKRSWGRSPNKSYSRPLPVKPKHLKLYSTTQIVVPLGYVNDDMKAKCVYFKNDANKF